MNLNAIESRQELLDPEWVIGADEKASCLLEHCRSANTRRAYSADWCHFWNWCAAHQLEPLPASPGTVARYLNDLSESVKPATLARRLSAISQAHKIASVLSPTNSSSVRQFMAELRRARGNTPTAKKPVLVDDLKAIAAQLPDTTLGVRDRAMLLLGFSGGFRRSELVGIDYADIAHTAQGLAVIVSRIPGASDVQGRTVRIPFGSGMDGTCPVKAVQHWCKLAQLEKGPLFRVVNRHGQVLEKRLSGEAVALVVKRWVESLGYDPAQFSGHSLRSGLAFSAAMAGKSETVIMQQTGHRSLATLRRYMREGVLFGENAAEGIGL